MNPQKIRSIFKGALMYHKKIKFFCGTNIAIYFLPEEYLTCGRKDKSKG